MSPIAVVRRSGALSIAAVSFLFLLGSAGMTTLTAAVSGILVVCLALPVLIGRAPQGGVPFSWWRLLPAALAIVSVTWSNWLLADPRSLENALISGLRVGYFVIPCSILAGYVDPFELGDHLGQRLRLPARPVIALVVALGRVDALADDWSVLMGTRRVRGLARTGVMGRARDYATGMLELLVGAIRQAGETTVAMQARGYSAPMTTGHRRTWLDPAPWRAADSALVVWCALLAAVPALVSYLTR